MRVLHPRAIASPPRAEVLVVATGGTLRRRNLRAHALKPPSGSPNQLRFAGSSVATYVTAPRTTTGASSVVGVEIQSEAQVVLFLANLQEVENGGRGGGANAR